MKTISYQDSLLARYPEIAEEWNYARNESISPTTIHYGSNTEVWWTCTNGHTYRKKVSERTRLGRTCPICRQEAGMLAAKRPDLISEWDSEKNDSITPFNCYATSKYKAWWICKNGHSYQRSVVHNCESNRCPVCVHNGDVPLHPPVPIEDSLLIAFPEIAREWHPTNNGSLTPSTVHKSGGATVWWLCPKGHSYEKIIRNRTIKGQNCPVCRIEEGCISKKRPDLIQYWDAEENGGRTPDNTLTGSEFLAHWVCKCGYRWQQAVCGRVNSPIDCPVCNNYVDNSRLHENVDGQNEIRDYQAIKRKAKNAPRETLLSEMYPGLISAWDMEKNTVNPYEIQYTYSKGVWWLCEKQHSWHTSIKVYLKQNGCPYCRGRKIWPGFNDFATLYPNMLNEWDYERNIVKPNTIAPGDIKKYHWICPKGHKYESAISSRTRLKTGCPYCANQKLLKGFNDFETLYPQLAADWDYEKNDGKLPSDYIGASEHYAWWKCKKGHSWKTMICTRVGGSGCPTCAKEFKTSIPEQATYFYCKKYFEDAISRYQPDWIGKSEIDIFIPSIKSAVEFDGRAWHKNDSKDIDKNNLCKAHGIRLFRVREPGLALFNDDCIGLQKISYPALSDAITTLLCKLGIDNPIVCLKNDLDSVYALMNYQEKQQSISSNYPEIAAEWDYEKNSPYLSPNVVNCNSKIKVYWVCSKGHSYEARVEHRTRVGSGCPYCAGKKVICGETDLESQCPSLAKEWDNARNTEKPSECYFRSYKKVWWKCVDGHSWQASIEQRVKVGSGCPYCAGQKAIPGKTDISTVDPALILQWDYEMNKDINPEELLPQSHVSAWWRCSYGHSWQATIKSRYLSKNRTCPVCKQIKSKG